MARLRCIDGVLFIDEAEGIQGAEDMLRQAMSEDRVSRLTVGQGKSGAWEGKKLEVDVTASIITTTTATALHWENQTRVFDLWIDESEVQTRQVLRMMANQAAGGEANARNPLCFNGHCWTRTSDPLLVRQVQNTPIFIVLANFWGKVHRFAVNLRWISPN
ncbi:MAG: hypothetical protein IIB37_12655 [Gemmatimonadetes bacterium]|nr:hypothetical protein [Gemmatimonadota bacterium]